MTSATATGIPLSLPTIGILDLGSAQATKDCTVARPARRAMMNWTGDLSCLNEILCEIPTADNPFDIGSI